MWQFMMSTARDMGMRVDWWVDERRDPVKSTTAAVRFIRGLRDQLGSLYLAAAAYNGGPGRVSRGMAKYAGDMERAQGEDAFFVLAEKDYLKTETRDYVPQLIAAALVGKEPALVRRERPHASALRGRLRARAGANAPARRRDGGRYSHGRRGRAESPLAERHDPAVRLIPRANSGGSRGRL